MAILEDWILWHLVFSSTLEFLDFHCILQSNLVKVDCETFSAFYASVVEMLTWQAEKAVSIHMPLSFTHIIFHNITSIKYFSLAKSTISKVTRTSKDVRTLLWWLLLHICLEHCRVLWHLVSRNQCCECYCPKFSPISSFDRPMLQPFMECVRVKSQQQLEEPYRPVSNFHKVQNLGLRRISLISFLSTLKMVGQLKYSFHDFIFSSRKFWIWILEKIIAGKNRWLHWISVITGQHFAFRQIHFAIWYFLISINPCLSFGKYLIYKVFSKT